MIESESFREFIHEIAPALDAFMISSSTTIRNWIMKLMKAQALVIKKKLARARSRVISALGGYNQKCGVVENECV